MKNFDILKFIINLTKLFPLNTKFIIFFINQISLLKNNY
jgi:hypothetical protein